jgi:hypothetical protein
VLKKSLAGLGMPRQDLLTIRFNHGQDALVNMQEAQGVNDIDLDFF